MRLVENLVVWNDFRWGEYIWRHLYDQIMNVVNKNKWEHLKGLSKFRNYVPIYTLSGFVWYFKTSVEEIWLKDGVISKLNSRVFKLEAIIKVLGQERKGVSLDKSCVAEFFKNFSSGCWEELNEEFNELCETKFCVNGPAMIDLDYDEDLFMISNGKRTQRSSAFSAYYWGNTFAMAEKDRPLNTLNDKDMNLFLKDVTPWVEDLSCYNRATDRVHLTDAFDIFLGQQGLLRCSFSFKTRSPRGMLMAFCTKSRGVMLNMMIVNVPTPYSSRLLGFNMDKEPIIKVDDIRYQMDITLQVYHQTLEQFQNLSVEAKIPEVMMQAKVFDQKGIDHTRYTISFTNARNVPKQREVFGDCGIWTCIFLYSQELTIEDVATLCGWMTSGAVSAMNVGKAECSNCKFLAEKIKTLEEKIKILEGTLETESHPENHTIKSAAILHECIMTWENLVWSSFSFS
nr:phospholipase-like protein [Tanacetum cinerariifolium]